MKLSVVLENVIGGDEQTNQRHLYQSLVGVLGGQGHVTLLLERWEETIEGQPEFSVGTIVSLPESLVQLLTLTHVADAASRHPLVLLSSVRCLPCRSFAQNRC
jgi:hypothetical protein